MSVFIGGREFKTANELPLATGVLAGDKVVVRRAGGAREINASLLGAAIDLSGYLAQSGNLAGLTDLLAARANLGLGNSTTRDVGTSPGQLVENGAETLSLIAAQGKTYRPWIVHDYVNRNFDIEYNGQMPGNQNEGGALLRLKNGGFEFHTKVFGQSLQPQLIIQNGGVTINAALALRNPISNLIFQGFDSTYSFQQFRVQEYSMAVGKVPNSVSVPEGALQVYSKSSAAPVLIVQGAPGQAANLQEWRDASGNLKSYIASDGTFHVV